MSVPPYVSGSSWSWPKEEPSIPDEDHVPGAFVYNELPAEKPREQQAHHTGQESAPKPQRHYPPRTCRICLEVVLPTFETPSEGLAGMLNPTPKVTYISQEPESGRLIRPCKCKGSQQYVHEGCLQDWRHTDPAYGRRNYWECPTCHFRYRLERMRWSRWISSTATQVFLTFMILFTTVFILGFVADPILNLYLDPVATLTTNPLSNNSDLPIYNDEDATWSDHILKGLASLGLLGLVKAIFAMGPWNWYHLRNAGVGGGRGGRAGTGRDRLENISWYFVAIGVITFLYAVWKGVRAWSRKTLEKAGERVADVQGDDDDILEGDVNS